MPVIIFIILYITGVMLSFARNSNLPGIRINTLLRIVIFMKIKERLIFIHALIFQILNIVLFGIFVLLYFIMNEKNISAVYNIYMWTSLVLFIIVITLTAVDAAILEKNGKADENN